ncbi:MAG: WD40 repeat domain-containing protein, partial [Ktedonobacteraceae bacterium]
MSKQPPCPEWADTLALRPDDLSPAARAALTTHLQACPACAEALADYHFLDALLYRLPEPAMKPLPRISPLLALDDEIVLEEPEEDHLERDMRSMKPAQSPLPDRRRRARQARFAHMASTFTSALSGTLVAGLILAMIFLFGTRYVTGRGPFPPVTALLTYRNHSNSVSALAWSPDGKYIASASWDKTVQVWDASNGNLLVTYRGHSDFVDALAWSYNGKYIASASWDHTVQVWNASTGARLFTYRRHMDFVDALAWSPDGAYIASASWDKTVQVWSASKGTPLFSYQGHSDIVNVLAWSPDGKHIASGSRDKTVQVWDAHTGAHLSTYRGHSD